MLILYMSNRYVRVVEGEQTGSRIYVRAVYEEEDWNGCILNGTITDEDTFIQLIEKIWAKYDISSRDIHLVIDSTQFNQKIMEMPILKPKQMEEYIQREFADVGRIMDPVYQFFTIGEPDKKTKQVSVFAMKAEGQFLRDYVELFSGAGFHVETVQSARGAAVHLLDFMKLVESGNGIIQFVDNMVLMNFLVAEGKIIFSDRVRLFSDPGTLDYVMEISHSVNNILQFALTQNLQQAVRDVMIGGLSEQDYQMYTEVLEGINPDLVINILTAGNNIRFDSHIQAEFHSCAVAVGGLLEEREKRGSLVHKVMNSEKEKKNREKRRKLLPVAALAAVMFVAVSVVGIRILYLNIKLKQVQAFNTREDVVESCRIYDETKIERDASLEFGNSMEQLTGRILDYPRVDSETEQIVAACAVNNMVEVEISSYNADGGTLSFDTSADRVERIHQFADQLRQRDIFAAVRYTGYTQDSDGNWSVKVNCTMADRQED